MRTHTRTATTVLAAALCLSVAACGGGESADEKEAKAILEDLQASVSAVAVPTGSNESAAPVAPTVPTGSGSAEEAARWKGVWKSTFGDLTMSTGAAGRVIGTYSYCAGTITGSVQGDTLTGLWMEGSQDAECVESRKGAAADGAFTWTLASGDKAFAGTWTYSDGSKSTSGDTWDGTRVE